MTFDIQGFEEYLMTYEGGNKDPSPAKAIAAHVKGFFRFTPETEPSYKALICFQSLQGYFTYLKATLKLCATTIQEKLRAIRQAIDYVAYVHNSNDYFVSRCQSVNNRLKVWGKAMTKDIRKQRHQNSLKSSYEVSVMLHLTSFMCYYNRWHQHRAHTISLHHRPLNHQYGKLLRLLREDHWFGRDWCHTDLFSSSDYIP